MLLELADGRLGVLLLEEKELELERGVNVLLG